MSVFPDRSLSESEMMEAMEVITGRSVPAEEVARFLVSMAERHETVEEIVGAARFLRERATVIKAPEDAVDCCGTGGDGKHTYNISTAVALVSAACDVPVAKHGNRAASSKCGAADVLEACGVRIDVPLEKLEEALRRFGFTFLMAPHHHPAIDRVREIRKKIGQRTIFNMLGPLLNPAGAKIQLIGVYERRLLPVMAEALQALGTEKAWVVHGVDGMDEITLGGFTYRCTLEDGKIREDRLAPEDFNLRPHLADALTGGDAETNAEALRRLLQGEKGAYHDSVLANAAAVLNLHGSAADLKSGVRQAGEAIDSGAALKVLEDYIAFTQGASA